MPTYLTIHDETHPDSELLESRWINLAQERAGTCVKIWFNCSRGVGFDGGIPRARRP